MRIALHHLPHIFDDLQRIQHTQCIRQHIPFDIRVHQCIHHLEDILRRIFHPVTPVFQVNVHLHILLIGIIHYANNILDMFFRGLSQLTCAMLQRTFAQKINDAAAGSVYPVYRRMPVYETQHLHPGQQITPRRPVTYHLDCVELTVRNPCRSHFHPVYFQFFQ